MNNLTHRNDPCYGLTALCYGLTSLRIMEKNVAARVVQNLLEISGRLDQTVGLIKAECSEAEFKMYRPAFGRAMGELYIEVFVPLFKEHPSLIPPDWTWLRKGLPPGDEEAQR
jgi:hypothetical protein